MKTAARRRRTRRQAQFVIDLGVTISILIAAGVVIWANWPTPPPPSIPLPTEPMALGGIPTKGDPASPVVLIAHSDFECPYCGRFARETLPAIYRLYVATGKVRLAFRHLALPKHRRALPAAIAAECAGRQAKFWEMHDRLFADQAKLDDASFLVHARAIGLDPTAFSACQADATIAEQINRETSEVSDLRITSTPAFLIGTVLIDGRIEVTGSLRGAMPVADMQEALDEALAQAAPTSILSIFSFSRPAGPAGAGAIVLLLAGLIRWRVRRRRLASAGSQAYATVSSHGQLN